MKRGFRKITGLDEEPDYVKLAENEMDLERHTNVSEAEGNVITSEVRPGVHMPVLDIDFEAQLLPSRTPGHYHLYLDHEIPWDKYEVLLEALSAAGIIEPGYARASVHRRATYVRKPGTKSTAKPSYGSVG